MLVGDAAADGPVAGGFFWVMLPMVGRSPCPEGWASGGALSRP